MRILVLIILIASTAGYSAEPSQSPQFRDFAVTNLFRGKPVDVDLASHPEAPHYRTQLRRQAAQGPDFAGHYRIATWGCGSSCAAFAIVDSESGRVYFPPRIALRYMDWV